MQYQVKAKVSSRNLQYQVQISSFKSKFAVAIKFKFQVSSRNLQYQVQISSFKSKFAVSAFGVAVGRSEVVASRRVQIN